MITIIIIMCSSQGHVFHCKLSTQASVLPKGRSSTANSETKVAVLLGKIGAVASRCFPHYTVSLASEQTLKYSI